MVALIRKITIQDFFFIGFLFFLPLNENVNTWFLIGFFLSSLFALKKKSNRQLLIDTKSLLIISSILFFLRLGGLFNAISFDVGLKELVRSVSFIALPFSILLLIRKHKQNQILFFFKLLTAGVLTAIIICWTYSISAVVRNNEPLLNIIGWKRSNEYLTRIIDMHPPYLGLIIAVCIIYLVYRLNDGRKWLKICVIVFLFLFLLNLAARNAIVFLILVLFVHLLLKRKWKTIIFTLTIILGFGIVVNDKQANFFRRKYIKMLNPYDELADQRFNRFKASWNIFVEYPVFGSGMGNDDLLRVQKYKAFGDTLAYESRYNAHNQYLEYLSTFGIIGLLLFLYVLYKFFKLSLSHREYLFFVLLSMFCFACLSESILERELGIKIFGLIVGLLIYSIKMNRITPIEQNDKL
ncbi:MAG: O-antigen ligase family protein [Flavobacteriaceae bacterium]|nr:O-antigen ligase family protein [Flavobacteriaceae bacterium]